MRFDFALRAALLFLVSLAASTAVAETLNVPGDYATIQAAIDAAVDGDVVFVAPGIYTENVSFLGKNIHVLSECGPALTTIVGSGGSVVTFENGEGSGAILEGFGVTGGTGTFGGGIDIEDASPVVRGNWIYDNPPASGGSVGFGAGVHLFLASGAVVEDNVIVGNRANGDGGGILVENASGVTIRNNIIARNECHGYGGGIAIVYAGTENVIEGCLIVENEMLEFAEGGALFVDTVGDVAIRGCTIANNSAAPYALAGIYVQVDSTFAVDNSIVWGNSAAASAGTLLDQNFYYHPSSTAIVSYADIEGGAVGADGFSLDPMFRQGSALETPMLAGLGDYVLSDIETSDPFTSPCVDSGDPGIAPVGSTRADGAPDVGTVDRGYHYEFVRFVRGDTNLDGVVDIGDAIGALAALFIPGADALSCIDAADINDDGQHDVTDAVALLSWLFVPGSPAIPAPGADACGVDPTVDDLGCAKSVCP